MSEDWGVVVFATIFGALLLVWFLVLPVVGLLWLSGALS